MRTVRRFNKLRWFLILFLFEINILIFPIQAFGHEPGVMPQVSGNVTCGGYANRHQIITWTVANSEMIIMLGNGGDLFDTAQGRVMTVDKIHVSSGWVNGIESQMKFPPRPLENSSREAITDLPGYQVGNVNLHVVADWDGEDSPQNVSGWAQVYLDGSCKGNGYNPA